MTNCKLITNIPCRFVITLSCNPAISLQSVRIDKIVYEHRRFRGNKKIRRDLTAPAEITVSRK